MTRADLVTLIIRPILLMMVGAMVSACGGFSDGRYMDAPFNGTGGSRTVMSITPAQVSTVQACAIGYDLAQTIHATISLRRTILLAPKRTSACERHTLNYLRKAGFQINDSDQSGASFRIALDRAGGDRRGQIVSAIAEIGDGLRISRTYRPMPTGVMANGPVSIQRLNPLSYRRRGS